jgi:glutamate synthase (NADPH/NADH) small chain
MPGTDFLLPVTAAVKAIGQQPRVELFAQIAGLELDEGRVKVDPETGQTTNPKYFSAGDATNGGATVVEAVRGAKIAARGVDSWVGRRRP